MYERFAGLDKALRVPAGVYSLGGRERQEAVFSGLADQVRLAEDGVLAAGGLDGYCRGCRRWTKFCQPPGSEWANLSEGLLCECGINGRMRGILAAVDTLLAGGFPPEGAAVFERMTPMFDPLQSRLPNLSGSEYMGDEYEAGAIVESLGFSVRHESLSGTSYETESLDLVMHFDVLEHVPDPVGALRECHRIIRRGGWLLFSTPFYEDLDVSIVRASVDGGGLQHHLPPVYHGNPVDGGGALVFTQFGWDLLAMVERAGFDLVESWLTLNPIEGVFTNACPYPDGHAWPLVFAAQRA